ncbi:dihydrofolate reductase family protein [Streptomyces sp. KL116D]|uniref:dihydrofolate reductase family protein n=1 Tax=Streptomyces sp. KL116D TaxID=3045152 RepID=UPI003556C31F
MAGERQTARLDVRNPERRQAELDRLTMVGAFIMGRTCSGPVRGAWDRQWKGWWGDNPPYHAPVFVLTHHPRDPQPMDGGTTFHFVTGGIKSALLQAREAAGGPQRVDPRGRDSPSTQYLAAGLVDELRLHIVPCSRSVPALAVRRRAVTES